MNLVLSVTIALLFGLGAYCLLRRSFMRVVIGLVLISQAANLLVFVAGGVSTGGPPIATGDQVRPPAGAADPLPQALVLTAIVIGFGLIAFIATLLHRMRKVTGADDVEELKRTDAL
ncbi:sodium:proton antiporter [Nibricoccus sp. IMCC34717]|uniref:sodium:proton antiporter n=1 Tax=Nibricoccus sp. IMCC34717 TaxID=3034021 RepID=UPI00384EE1DF